MNEREMLGAVQSHHFVELVYSFQDSTNLHLVTEFLPGGDLMGLLIRRTAISENETASYCAEIAIAINHVHQLGYVHHDMK